MKSKERIKLETTYAHTAQIFCKTLRQVRHKEFYENTHTNFQAIVYPLTSADYRHLSSMRDLQRAISSTPIFLNNYLKNIVKNGAKYSANLAIRSVSNSNHLVNISRVTPPKKQLSSASSPNSLITWNSHIVYLCNPEGDKFVPEPVAF